MFLSGEALWCKKDRTWDEKRKKCGPMRDKGEL